MAATSARAPTCGTSGSTATGQETVRSSAATKRPRGPWRRRVGPRKPESPSEPSPMAIAAGKAVESAAGTMAQTKRTAEKDSHEAQTSSARRRGRAGARGARAEVGGEEAMELAGMVRGFRG